MPNLIIRFGTCKVRRLKRALDDLTYNTLHFVTCDTLHYFSGESGWGWGRKFFLSAIFHDMLLQERMIYKEKHSPIHASLPIIICLKSIFNFQSIAELF